MNLLMYNEVARLALDAGLSVRAAVVAVAIAKAESNLDTEAIGDTALVDATWGPSVGLWQIRSLVAERNTGLTRDATRLTDPSFNARSMASIGRASWQPWSVWKNLGYRRWMGAAAAAVLRVSPWPHADALPSTADVLTIQAEISARFTGFTELGVYNCRRKNNSPAPAPWSEHAWANAWDIGTTKVLGDQIAGSLRVLKAGGWPIGELLWQVTGHFDHVHVSGLRRNPDGQQVPPCAANPPPASSLADPTTLVGVVQRIQIALRSHGFTGLGGKVLVSDGEFGPHTYAAFDAAMKAAARARDLP